MGIISRFINVVRAYSNSFLDKAEDPEKMLQQMLSDLEGQKRQAKQQMTEALALHDYFFAWFRSSHVRSKFVNDL